MAAPDPVPPDRPAEPAAPPAGSGAASVAAGILSSRILGLLRETMFAHYFGVGPHADAFTAALRVPNLLQNLLGEGALSASFIPIYSRLLAEGKREEAGRFAGAIFGLLLAAAAGLALLGVTLAPALVALIAPGFLHDAARVAAGTLAVDRFALTVGAVRILFPMTGILVLSAWALAVLNSHRRFFLPYFAPALWNAAIIAALAWTGRGLLPGLAGRDHLFFAACWGAFLGGLLQFSVQLPVVARALSGFRFSLSLAVSGVREALAAWGPVVAGRGVVQLAGFLDLFLATLLATGAASADRFAQMLYLLPIGLFGVSVAASELPGLSRLRGDEARGELLARVRRALSLVAFLNIPTVVGYLTFGFLVIAGFYRTGVFGAADNWLVYLVLCGYSTGILATTSSRLLQNTFYALGESKVPARIAVVRVLTSAAVALPLMFALDRIPLSALIPSVGRASKLAASPLFLGALGLSFASGAGAWFELSRLVAALRKRVPEFALPWRADASMLALAGAAAVPAAVLWWLLPPIPRRLQALLVLATYGSLYLLFARLAGVEELAALIGRLGRRRYSNPGTRRLK